MSAFLDTSEKKDIKVDAVMNLEDEDLKKINEFKEWMLSNGASWPKIQWPCEDLLSGSRGAIALDDIDSGEVMMDIPGHLMMSPPIAFSTPHLGEVLLKHAKELLDDLLLAIFIMYEVSKGKESFYYPYINILPSPESSMLWNDKEIRELQDSRLTMRIRGRKASLRTVYEKRIRPIFNLYPDIFEPIIDFSYDKFAFAWFCIQARAFGRRLPWTAMVPFADCLNHTNVQTKYDYEEDGNSLFRLFPSGQNSYKKGTEVFNSYGRRPNDNLLLDYGFAMLDNQWEKLDLMFTIGRDIELFVEKCALFHEMRMPVVNAFMVRRQGFPLEALMSLRLRSLNESEYDYIMLRKQDHHSERQDKDQLLELLNQPLCISNELRALKSLEEELNKFLEMHQTTREQDELILKGSTATAIITSTSSNDQKTVIDDKDDNGKDDDKKDDDDETMSPRKWCAVTYRLTRKNIAYITIQKISHLISYIKTTIQKGNKIKDNGIDNVDNVDNEDKSIMKSMVSILLGDIAPNDLEEQVVNATFQYLMKIHLCQVDIE